MMTESLKQQSKMFMQNKELGVSYWFPTDYLQVYYICNLHLFQFLNMVDFSLNENLRSMLCFIVN